MATSFAATNVIPASNDGLRSRSATYKLQLPSSWLAAGIAWDLSADFTEVSEISFGGSGAVTDQAYKFAIIGTAGSYGLTASTVKIVAHYSTDAAGAMTAVPDATDLSAVDDLFVVVKGYKA